MAIGWSNDRVRLVPLEKERHFENCFQWVNDEDVTEWILVGDFPLSRLAEEKIFERLSEESKTDLVFAIELLDGTHIGQSGIHGMNLRHGYATTGSFIGVPEMRGLGYGTEAAKLRAWFCFHVLGLRVLYSEYLGGNDRSRRMSEKTGFIECGRLPDRFWKRGAYRDDVQMVLTRERWMELSGGQKNW